MPTRHREIAQHRLAGPLTRTPGTRATPPDFDISLGHYLTERRVGILDPHQHPSRVLQQPATDMKRIRNGLLGASPLPDALSDAHGTFHKPKGW